VHRLRIVTRADLAPGLQIAQAVHAALAWQAEHPGLGATWMATSNTVAVLVAPS
jgi:homospermidine synthase